MLEINHAIRDIAFMKTLYETSMKIKFKSKYKLANCRWLNRCEISLKIMYQKRSDLEQALTKEDYQLAEKYIHAPQSTSLDKGRIEKEIKMLEESLTSYLRQRETKRQQDVQNLENEKNSRNQMYEAGVRMLEINQSALDQKDSSPQ